MSLPLSLKIKATHSSCQTGQTIIEVLIAIVVGAIVLTAIAATAIIANSNAQFSQKKTLALKYLEEGIEDVRIARDTTVSWEDFLATSWGDESLTGGFTRSTTVAETVPDQATVTVGVSWSDAKGTHQVSSTTILTQWEQ